MSKYKLTFKADDFALSNPLAKAEDGEWEDIVALKEKVYTYMRSQGYFLMGDTDYLVVYTEFENPTDKTWAVIVDFDNKEIAYMKIHLEEDGYFGLFHGNFWDIPLLKFFDKLGFEIEPEATRITGQTIEDWWGTKNEKV